MNRWYRRTRSPSFLIALAATIIGLGIIAAVIVSRFTPKIDDTTLMRFRTEHGAQDEAFQAFVEHLKKSKGNFYEVLDILPDISFKPSGGRTSGIVISLVPDEEQIVRAGQILNWKPAEIQVASSTYDCLSGGKNRGGERLTALADSNTPYAFYGLGICNQEKHVDAGAAVAFEQEANKFDHEGSRRRAISFYIKSENKDALLRLKKDPKYSKLFDKHTRLELAILEKDLKTIFQVLIPTTFHSVRKDIALLAFVTGLMWLLFSMQSAHYLSRRGYRSLWIIFLAVGLGVLSIPVTHLFIALQEGWLHIKESPDLLRSVLFYFVGVGLREELAKLLCFLPLIPLLRNRKEFEVLVAASCAGLGFAIVENLTYYGNFGVLIAPSRLLTANFFHMAATGVTGLAAFQAARGKIGHDEALSQFALVVALHGIYDALLSVPGLTEYSYFATVAYIYLCYLYFHELRQSRPSFTETISLSANFTAGVSTVLATTIVFLSLHLTVWDSVFFTVQTGLYLAILIFMFFRELPESLVR